MIACLPMSVCACDEKEADRRMSWHRHPSIHGSYDMKHINASQTLEQSIEHSSATSAAILPK